MSSLSTGDYELMRHFMIAMVWIIVAAVTICANEAYCQSKREDYER